MSKTDSRLKDALKELEDVKKKNVELTRTVQELKEKVTELTVEPKATSAFDASDVISKLKEFGLKCSRLHERIEADSEKSPEAQRIVELEAELEKLRMEKSEEIKKMEMEKIALSKEVYVMVNEMSSKVQDLEKARKKEEMEKEVLKKELDLKKGEISALREQLRQADKTDKPLSIGTSILGKWQLKRTSCSTFIASTIEFTMTDGTLREIAVNSSTGKQTINDILPLDDPTYEYDEKLFAHTFIKDNCMISKMNLKKNGRWFISIERSVERNLLTRITTFGNLMYSVKVYERIV